MHKEWLKVLRQRYVSEETSKKIRKAELYVYIFSYLIYVAPGCIIVHLPLTTVGVCVDSVGVGQVYGGGVDGNVHVALILSLKVEVPPNSPQSARKSVNPSPPARRSNLAIHVPSVGVAVCPPMVGGTHVDGGVGGFTVVLPSGQVTATAQADCSWLLLAVAELVILFVLSAVALELESLVAEFVFVFVLLAEAFCIIGTIDVAPKTSIDVIAATIMILLIVWFIFLSQWYN